MTPRRHSSGWSGRHERKRHFEEARRPRRRAAHMSGSAAGARNGQSVAASALQVGDVDALLGRETIDRPCRGRLRAGSSAAARNRCTSVPEPIVALGELARTALGQRRPARDQTRGRAEDRRPACEQLGIRRQCTGSVGSRRPPARRVAVDGRQTANVERALAARPGHCRRAPAVPRRPSRKRAASDAGSSAGQASRSARRSWPRASTSAARYSRSRARVTATYSSRRSSSRLACVLESRRVGRSERDFRARRPARARSPRTPPAAPRPRHVQVDDEHDRELEALRRVNRHQVHGPAGLDDARWIRRRPAASRNTRRCRRAWRSRGSRRAGRAPAPS